MRAAAFVTALVISSPAWAQAQAPISPPQPAPSMEQLEQAHESVVNQLTQIDTMLIEKLKNELSLDRNKAKNLADWWSAYIGTGKSSDMK